jgi:hypothetical protein
MSDKKMPDRDQKELDNIRDLFEKGLNEASKDPEKLEEIRRDKERLIKPWKDYLKGWKKKDDAKTKVAARFMIANSAITVQGGERNEYIDAVWDMYSHSYAKLGMHVPNKSGLLKYDRWEIFMNAEDKPHAFACLSATPYGFKGGLAGSDGSGPAKSDIKAYLRSAYNRSGFFSEVSHAVEHITSGAPKVCAVDAGKILGKPIVPSADGLHYTRSLPGVGLVEKIMVGHPKSVDSSNNPKCETPKEAREKLAAEKKKAAEKLAEEQHDMAEHLSNQLDLDE